MCIYAYTNIILNILHNKLTIIKVEDVNSGFLNFITYLEFVLYLV